jgi:hypothetical protein
MAVAVDSPAPEIVIVGHGPERPNTFHPDDDRLTVVVPVFVFVPYLVVVPPLGSCAAQAASSNMTFPSSPNSVFGRFMNDPTARFLSNQPARAAMTPDLTNVNCHQPARNAHGSRAVR